VSSQFTKLETISDEPEPTDAEQRQVADEHPDDKLAEHRRWVDALSGIATELSDSEYDGERQHDRSQCVAVRRSGRSLEER